MNYDEYLREYEKKRQNGIYIFTGQFFGVLFLTFIVSSIFGLVPDQWNFIQSFSIDDKNVDSYEELEVVEYDEFGIRINSSNTNSQRYVQEVETPVVVTSRTAPTKIVIPKIGVNSIIGQPSSPNIDVLDQYLGRGAVYYPGSGTIESGNIFLFGHSTNWKVVQNQAYKTFNDLDKLSSGDIIELYAGGVKHKYSVQSVSLKDSSDALVNLSKTGDQTLTISTCNSFGAKQERWVVEAKRIS